jgi:RNA polymerase sigma-70 factor, ECF subfamily
MSAPPSAEDARRFERHLGPILDAAYGTAVHLTRNVHDAEDLVQEAAFLAFRAFHQFEEGTRFKAWYFRILTNLFYQRVRQQKRQPVTVELDDAPALYLFDRSHQAGLAAHAPDPADFIMSKLTTEQVSRALADLPEEYRVVAALYFMEDFGYQEIADILGCPLGTVRSRLHRGRRALQKSLWSIAVECGIVPATPKEENG